MTKKRPFANSIGSRQARIGICVFLVAITWLVFGQTLRHGFINYDDPVYVYENPVVKERPDSAWHRLGLHPQSWGQLAPTDIDLAHGWIASFTG
jgi:hypothetical protein